MTMLTHPAWSGSKLPPRIISKLNSLPSDQRRLYLSDLIANYELQTCNIDAVARKMSDNYVKKQVEHLRDVLHELTDMLDLELGYPPTFHEVSDDGITTQPA